ncbi:ABC transporter permease [Microbacterium sp. GXF7504]
MTRALSFTVRNLSVFFRDRAQVGLALLSALILLAIYGLFLGSLQVDSLQAALPGATDEDVRWFVNAWVLAGTTMITTVTASIAGLATFVEDRSSGRFKDFVVTPVHRGSLMLGYLAATFTIAFSLTLVVLAVGQGYLLTQDETAMDAGQLASAVGYSALSCAAFSALASFVVTFVRSSGAYSSLATIVGTAVGFLAGAYIAPGVLPEGVATTLGALPFMHAAMLIRIPYTADALAALTAGQPGAEEQIAELYGITSTVGDVEITPGLALASLGAVVVVFAVLGGWRVSRTIR